MPIGGMLTGKVRYDIITISSSSELLRAPWAYRYRWPVSLRLAL